MYGIFAAVGHKNIVGVLLEGLCKFEYRGYDSAGIAVLNGNGLVHIRSAGRVPDLAAETEEQHLVGETGIAHTRWATHGAPYERNAHPQISNRLAVVHNGIIENHEQPRAELKAAGYEFTSDTDSEVIAHLVHHNLAITLVIGLEPQIKVWAQQFANKYHALFLGRGVYYPIAPEGALKLKEITYIHAEAYSAGELKHGLLALVDKNMPVVSVTPNDALLEKLKSNLQEVKAQGGELFVLADANTGFQASEGAQVITVPDHAANLSPIVHTIPLQLLSYHTVLAKGTDVDKPRNLAKSVTVE